MTATNPLVWSNLHWPRPLNEDVALRVMRAWASDQRSPVVVLEVRSDETGVRYLLGSPRTDVGVVRAVLLSLGPGAVLTPLDAEDLYPPPTAKQRRPAQP